ncbi:hypothetical protein C8R47DRAFT_1168138 [Mycena vitilis]|nr:hypothetical protein C8R47DRAFT_1168138 [Mycena vitilis]
MEEEEEQLFIDEQGAPLKFYFHKSIKQEGTRAALQTKIEANGGIINATDAGSNVILVNPNDVSGHLDGIRHAYKTHTNFELKGVYVEPISWVKNCVMNGKCTHYFVQKGMGGYTGYRERTDFTEEDDDHLAYYLAVLIPEKTAGGRTGNSIYKLLMNNTEILEDEYRWALRHTWQSWRERYKKKQEWFDARIIELDPKIKAAPHQRYHLNRNAPRRSVKYRMDDRTEEEEEEEEEELEEQDELEDDEVVEVRDTGATSRKRPISASGSGQRDAKKQRREPIALDADGAQHTPSKGKEKAPPQDDEDYDDNSLFDGPTPDPSQLTSPPRSTQPTTQPGRSPQSTLVGTAPPRDVSPPVSPAKVRELPQPQQPSRVLAPPIDSRPTPQAHSRPTPQAKRKPVFEPTYRATRARSRSLEPYVADVDAVVVRKNKQQGRKKALETLEEIRVEEEKENPSTRTLSRAEGTEETQEVEDFLMDANEQSGISDGGNPVNDDPVDDVELMPPPRMAARQTTRQHSLETDDAQTDAALSHRSVSFSPVASSAREAKTKEVLRELQAVRRLSRQPESVTSKAASSPRLAQSSPPDVFTGPSRRGPSIDLQNPLYSQSVADRRSLSRKNSVSSAESFPIIGTRAKTLKQEIKKQEKHTPYRPPVGTRAADVVNSGKRR